MASGSTSGVGWSSVITSNNHGALVSITAWLMLIAGLMFLGVRMMIRYPFRTLLGSDDYMAIGGTFLALVHTVAILIAVKYGLGRHVKDVIEQDGNHAFHRMGLAIYIGEIFLVLGVTCSKLSVSLLFVRLASGRRHIRPAWILSGIILLWGIASTIGVGVSSPFRKQTLPEHNQPWPKSWIVFSALNIALEVALFLYPLYLVWDLQMSMKSKATVIIGFALRIPTSVVAIMRLFSLIQASHAVTDISWTYVRTAILTEVEMHYSLIAATIPCMHLFLRHFSTGYLSTTADQYCAEGSRGGTNNDSYGMYSSSTSAENPARTKERHDEATDDFDFGDDFPKSKANRPISTPGLHLTASIEHRSDICTKQQAKSTTNEGWATRASGCAGSTTTKIAHSQHASDGSVTSDGSDRIIVKKTVDVRYDTE